VTDIFDGFTGDDDGFPGDDDGFPGDDDGFPGDDDGFPGDDDGFPGVGEVYALKGAVKYEYGSSNPTGYFNITFPFNGTSVLLFTSISFEWLVVAENCAMFGGTDVIDVFDEGGTEGIEAPYVVTLCDNKEELNGQDTFFFMGGFPDDLGVFWSTSFDPVDEEDLFDEGSVNITSSTTSSSPSTLPSSEEAPSFAPSTWPSHGSKKSKKEGGKAGKAGSYKEGGKAGKAGSYKEGGKAGKAGNVRGR
jgi:hypothetical protein